MAFVLMSRPRGKTPVSMMSRPGRKSRSVQRAIDSQIRFEGSALQSRVAMPSAAPMIQAKLKIGEPNDKFEQEADRTADVVMRVPDSAAGVRLFTKPREGAPVRSQPLSASTSSIQRLCPSVMTHCAGSQ